MSYPRELRLVGALRSSFGSEARIRHRPGPGCTLYFTSPSWSVEIQLHGWKRVAPLYSTTTPRSFTPLSSHRVRLPLLMVMTRICSPIQLLGTCSSATIILPARVVSACISYLTQPCCARQKPSSL